VGGDFTNGSRAIAISGDGGTIVGRHDTLGAFYWTQEAGLQSIRSVLVSQGIDMTGWSLTEATDISGNGRFIVGFGTNPAGNQEAWLVHLRVPEPASIMLVITLLIAAQNFASFRPRG
jgi:hypothetical protein